MRHGTNYTGRWKNQQIQEATLMQSARKSKQKKRPAFTKGPRSKTCLTNYQEGQHTQAEAFAMALTAPWLGRCPSNHSDLDLFCTEEWGNISKTKSCWLQKVFTSCDICHKKGITKCSFLSIVCLSLCLFTVHPVSFNCALILFDFNSFLQRLILFLKIGTSVHDIIWWLSDFHR